jgi:diguanylate cyclase (GGDEF)-like protein
MSGFLQRWHDFILPPDPALVATGEGGVRSVAITRLWFIGVAALAPAVGFLVQGWDTALEVRLSSLGLAAAFVYSLLVYRALERRNWRPSRTEAYVTATFDLTLVTGTLLLLGFAADPERVIHSEAVWAVYLLIIMTSALRLDVRICFYMGVMAIAQYVLMVAVFDLAMPESMAGYDRLIQFARVTLMMAATALAVGIVNRSRSLMRVSGFDPLTGLANRRYFNERLTDEAARARHARRPLSLVLFDLDYFKRVNDRFGHEVGDQVLLQITDLLRRQKRDQDFLARWGGEELAMILPDTDLESASRVARRLANAIRDTEFQTLKGTVRVTASAGLAELGRDCERLEELFARADA